jgi:hypothetical protein
MADAATSHAIIGVPNAVSVTTARLGAMPVTYIALPP